MMVSVDQTTGPQHPAQPDGDEVVEQLNIFYSRFNRTKVGQAGLLWQKMIKTHGKNAAVELSKILRDKYGCDLSTSEKEQWEIAKKNPPSAPHLSGKVPTPQPTRQSCLVATPRREEKHFLVATPQDEYKQEACGQTLASWDRPHLNYFYKAESRVRMQCSPRPRISAIPDHEELLDVSERLQAFYFRFNRSKVEQAGLLWKQMTKYHGKNAGVELSKNLRDKYGYDLDTHDEDQLKIVTEPLFSSSSSSTSPLSQCKSILPLDAELNCSGFSEGYRSKMSLIEGQMNKVEEQGCVSDALGISNKEDAAADKVDADKAKAEPLIELQLADAETALHLAKLADATTTAQAARTQEMPRILDEHADDLEVLQARMSGGFASTDVQVLRSQSYRSRMSPIKGQVEKVEEQGCVSEALRFSSKEEAAADKVDADKAAAEKAAADTAAADSQGMTEFTEVKNFGVLANILIKPAKPTSMVKGRSGRSCKRTSDEVKMKVRWDAGCVSPEPSRMRLHKQARIKADASQAARAPVSQTPTLRTRCMPQDAGRAPQKSGHHRSLSWPVVNPLEEFTSR